MSIKIEEVSQPQEFVYPLAFRSRKTTLVVLFTGKREGIVVTDNPFYTTGHVSTSWDPHTFSSWEPVNLTISHP